MKKTLVSLFALLAMGSTAFADDNAAVEKTATVKTKVVAPLTVTQPSELNLGMVIKGETRNFTDKNFEFTVDGETGETFNYDLTNETTTDNKAGLTVTFDESVTSHTGTNIALGTLTFNIQSVAVASDAISGIRTLNYKLAVSYYGY